MDTFWKAVAIVLLSLVMILTIGKTEKDISVLLSMSVCCIVATLALSYLKPVLSMLWEFHSFGNLEGSFLKILLKASGIALGAELTAMLCDDAGNAALGKAIQLLGTAAILSLSIPLFHGLITLVQEILGEL